MEQKWIALQDVSKSFKEQTVLQDVSFKLESGSMNAIVGENGAGKSTLLKIVMGILKADQGHIEIEGTLGYCPQEFELFSLLTVQENIDYFKTAYGLERACGNGTASDWKHRLFNTLNFTSILDSKTGKLSGGTKQKLNLIISLLHNPDILILDEPYGGFDWSTYQSFLELMTTLRQQNKCVLLVTHMLNELSYFDNVLTLKDGQIQ